jgi:hypothetical protein
VGGGFITSAGVSRRTNAESSFLETDKEQDMELAREEEIEETSYSASVGHEKKCKKAASPRGS